MIEEILASHPGDNPVLATETIEGKDGETFELVIYDLPQLDGQYAGPGWTLSRIRGEARVFVADGIQTSEENARADARFYADQG